MHNIYDHFYWHTAKCEDPQDGPSTYAANSIQISGYDNPALQGENITISCESGLPLTGSNSLIATCLDSGQWEPNPREIECEGE